MGFTYDPNNPLGSLGDFNFGGGEDEGNPLKKILDIIGSKGGQTLVNAAGAGMAAYGQNKQAEADRAQSAGQFKANMAQRQLESSQADQRSRAGAVVDANPLGANQLFAQRNALAQALLGGARNFSATPGDPRVAAAMGQVSGGMRLPEGGLDPAMLERLFGDAATQSSIAERSKNLAQINPRMALPPIEDLFGRSADGSENAFMTDVRTTQQSALDRELAESERAREMIRRALEEDIEGNKKKSGGKGIGSRLAGAGMGALSGFASGGPIGALIGGIGGLF